LNGDFGKRVLGPALIPLGAFVFIGALVFGFSRILLAVPKDGSVIVAVLLAGCVLLGSGALSRGSALKPPQRAALIAFGVMVLGGGVAAGVSLGVRPGEEAPLKVAATITAHNTAFDKSELDLPAGIKFILKFDNTDPLAHNVSIYKDRASGERADPAANLFKGTIFSGPKVENYPVEKPLAKGLYYFRCDVHASMFGVARVGGATGSLPGLPGPGPSGSPGATPTPTPTPSPSGPAPSPTTIALTAQGIMFDKHALTFAALGPVTIDFDNKDSGQLHNFALYRDAGYTDRILSEPFVTGPGTSKYQFPAPGPGTYYFECEAHPIPNMRGTVTVR
jgi:plastocyanin